VAVTDKAVQHDGVICYGAIGVGGTKMKAHKAALAKLFESNDQSWTPRKCIKSPVRSGDSAFNSKHEKSKVGKVEKDEN